MKACVFVVLGLCAHFVSPRGLPGGRGHGTGPVKDTAAGTESGLDHLRQEFDPGSCTGGDCNKKLPRVTEEREVKLGHKKAKKGKPKHHEEKKTADSWFEMGIQTDHNVQEGGETFVAGNFRTDREKNRQTHRARKNNKNRPGTRKQQRKLSRGKNRNKDTSRAQADERSWLASPPGVARLEQRLHPNVHYPVQHLKDALQRVLRAIQSSVKRAEIDYSYIFNSTRYDIMMGVREELMRMSKENDKAYDAILQTSLLTKQIYLRAHERRRNGQRTIPMAVTSHRAPVKHMYLREYQTNVQEEMKKAESLKTQILQTRRKRDAVASQFMEVGMDIKERLPSYALRDLTHRANQTLHTLKMGMPDIDMQDKIHLYHYEYVNHINNVKHARHMTKDAKKMMRHARKTLMVGKDLASQIKRAQTGDAQAMVQDMPFSDAEMMMWWAVDRARLHADSLVRDATNTHMSLQPMIEKAKEAAASKDGNYFTRKLEQKAVELRDILQLLHTVIGTLQDEVGYTPPVKKARKKDCDDLVEGSGEITDDCLTDLDEIEGSGVEIEGSGNDGIDDEVDITIVDGSKVGNTEDTVVVDGGTTIVEVTDKQSPASVTPEEDSGLVIEPSETSDSSDDDFTFTDLFGFLSDDPAATDNTAKTEVEKAAENTFNTMVLKHLQDLESASKAVYEVASQLKSNLTELAREWDTLKSRVVAIENRTRTAKLFTHHVAADALISEANHDRVVSLSNFVNNTVMMVEGQCVRAVELAEKKVTQMEAKQEVKGNSGASDVNPEDVAKTKEAAQAIRKNVGEIRELKQVFPEPCKRVQSIRNGIHTNITELRQKIEKAKTIAASIQMAVSLKGSGYLTVPIATDDVQKSLTTSMDMMVKPTGTDGPIAVLKTDKVGSFVVSVKDRSPVLTVLDEDDDDLDEIESDFEMAEGAWYQVSVTRSAATYLLSVSNNTESYEGNATFDDVPTMQVNPTTAYFGGVPDSFPTFGSGQWDGCLGEVTVNGRSVNVLTVDSAGDPPTVCPRQQSAVGAGMQLGGRGYVQFPWSVITGRQVETVSIQFTAHSDGLVFYHTDPYTRDYGLVWIKAGHIMAEVVYQGQTTAVQSSESTYNASGQRHQLKLSINRGNVVATIDGGTTFSRVSPAGRALLPPGRVESGLYVGGLPSQHSSGLGSLTGCIAELRINTELVPLSLLQSSVDVYSGTCGDTECVQFGGESSPIDLGEAVGRNHIKFSFLRGSLGPIVQYSKEKFSVTVSIDPSGVDVTESNSDTDYRIEFTGDDNDTLIFGSIDDGGKAVEVVVNGMKVSHSYGSAWDLFADADDDAFDITIGGSSDHEHNFDGQLVDFIMNGRRVDTAGYLTSNNLHSCTVPKPPLLIEQTPSEKFEC